MITTSLLKKKILEFFLWVCYFVFPLKLPLLVSKASKNLNDKVGSGDLGIVAATKGGTWIQRDLLIYIYIYIFLSTDVIYRA